MLTRDKLAYTRRCLESFLLSAHRPLEIVVVDNGSSDGTPDWLEGFRAQAVRARVGVRLQLNSGNSGCSTARNQGLGLCRGEIVAFLDNDTELRQRSWIARLLRALEETGAAVAGPKLLYPWAPHPIQCAGVVVTLGGRPVFLGRGESLDDPRFAARREVPALISACWLARRRALLEAGGFDEAFNPVQFEDFDLCYRLRGRGARVVYEPCAEVYHHESTTTAGTPRLPNTYLVVKNGLLFKQRWRAMYSSEGGPPEAAARWRDIPPCALAELPAPPILP